ncbi:probable glutamate receptor [Physella acuta]|uniref:probable glutamate receptor n=1 Tax=Physella acuta TaxID=109671 RepID=UPI0027DD98F2|nr:probable glutamate receptor [Physella acuta]
MAWPGQCSVALIIIVCTGLTSRAALPHPRLVESLDVDQRVTSGVSDLQLFTVRVLKATFQHMHWTRLMLVHDTMHEPTARRLMASYQNGTVQAFHLNWQMSPEADHVITCAQYLKMADSQRMTGLNVRINQLLDGIYKDHVTNDVTVHVVLLCSDNCTKSVLQEANVYDCRRAKSTALHMHTKWLIVENELKDFLELLDHLDNVATIKVFTRPLHATVWTLYFGGNNSRHLTPVALVSAGLDIDLLGGDAIFPNINFGLNHRTLVVSTKQWLHFVTKSVEDGRATYDGFCMDVLQYLQRALNFTSQMVEPADDEWGRLLDNGSFTGLMGQLQRKEVDLVAAPLTIHEMRERVMDFTFPYFVDYTSVMMKLPDPADRKWLTIIQPFRWEVHLAILMSLIFTSCLLTFMERHNPHNKTRDRDNSYRWSRDESFLGFYHTFWYLFGALFTQGGERLPTSLTGRSLLTCWWIFTIVISSTYSGNLIAFLTVSKQRAPFDTLADMLAQDSYKWGFLGTTLYELVYKSTDEAIHQAIWQHIVDLNQSDPAILSRDEMTHLKAVQRGDYAYIGDRTSIELWMEQDCQLVKVKEKFFPLQYGLGLVNNSPYTRLFSEEVMQMCEFGLVNIWIARWWRKQNRCGGAVVADATPISVLDVQSACYTLGLGLVLAALCLAGERCVQLRLGRARFC